MCRPLAPTQLLTNHYERCWKYYCLPTGWASFGVTSEEELHLTRKLFWGIFDSLAHKVRARGGAPKGACLEGLGAKVGGGVQNEITKFGGSGRELVLQVWIQENLGVGSLVWLLQKRRWALVWGLGEG